MHKQSSTLLLVVTGLFAALAACGHDEPAKSPDNNASTPVAAAPDAGEATERAPASSAATAASEPPATPATADAGAAASAPAAEAAPTLTDEDILQVLHTANRGEIEQGVLAQTKAHDARVKKLAAMMVKDHTAADAKGTTLSKKEKLSPAQNTLASSIQSDAESTTASLKTESGSDFDRAYVDAQVKEHQAVLDTIDQKLLPAAKNADLKAFITEVRPKIAMHLQHAEDLQKSLQK